MATTISGLTFYEEWLETGMFLGLAQNVNGFNEASANTIRLLPGEASKGLLPKTTFLTRTPGLLQARDPQSAGSVTPVRPSGAEHGSAKMFWTAAQDFNYQEWEDQGLDTEVGTENYGLQMGEDVAQMHLHSAISALVGAIGAIGAGAIYDGSAGTFDYTALNASAAKMGDMRPMLRAMITHSVPLFSLVGEAYSNQAVAFQMGSATIYNGSIPTMGLLPVNTDAAPLFIAGIPDNYYTLMLVQGAVEVKTGPLRTNFANVTGDASSAPENLLWRMQTEGSYEIKVKGVSYIGAGTPNDAALANPANWTAVAPDAVKQGPGIRILTQ